METKIGSEALASESKPESKPAVTEALSPKCIFCGSVWKGLTGPQPTSRRCGRCEEELEEARSASLGPFRSEVVEAARVLARGNVGVDDLKVKVAALEAAEAAFDAEHHVREHV